MTFDADDPSYAAFVKAALGWCRCCQQCGGAPCNGCLAGGVCDCDELSCICFDSWPGDADGDDWNEP